MDRGEVIWICFKYEKLPNFYYTCGKVRHTLKDYEEVVSNEKEDTNEDRGYGDWLRASSFKRSSVVVDPKPTQSLSRRKMDVST